MADEVIKLGMEDVKVLLSASLDISVLLIKHLKHKDYSGAVSELLLDENRAKIDAAIQSVSKAGAEIKDLDLAEGIELAVLAAQKVPAILAALK